MGKPSCLSLMKALLAYAKSLDGKFINVRDLAIVDDDDAVGLVFLGFFSTGMMMMMNFLLGECIGGKDDAREERSKYAQCK